MNLAPDYGVMQAMRSLLLGLLALSTVACTTTDDLVPAPSNLFEVELWEFESASIPVPFIPDRVSAIFVEVTVCQVDSEGPGYLWVGTAFSGEEFEPRDCSTGVDVHQFWLSTEWPHDVWMEATPVYTRDTTSIVATFEVLGW